MQVQEIISATVNISKRIGIGYIAPYRTNTSQGGGKRRDGFVGGANFGERALGTGHWVLMPWFYSRSPVPGICSFGTERYSQFQPIRFEILTVALIISCTCILGGSHYHMLHTKRVLCMPLGGTHGPAVISHHLSATLAWAPQPCRRLQPPCHRLTCVQPPLSVQLPLRLDFASPSLRSFGSAGTHPGTAD